MIDVPKLLTPKLLRPTLVLTERARSFSPPSAPTIDPNFVAYTNTQGYYYTNAADDTYVKLT